MYIVRANQKDVYYQAILQEQMTRVAQQFLGARRQHVWQKEINTVSDICYYGLTTLLGTQTLGEEYCDIVQINQYNQTYPGLLVSFLFFFCVCVFFSKESLLTNHIIAPFLTCIQSSCITLYLYPRSS
jgi:peroxin-10